MTTNFSEIPTFINLNDMRNLLIFFSILYCVNANSQRITPPEPERNRTYDVRHIDIKVKVDLLNKSVNGNVKTTISPLTDGMTEFETDAVALEINYIKDIDGNDLKYDYNRTKLKIYTANKLNTGDILIYETDYSCSPQKGMHFIYPNEFNPSLPYQVWTQGESENNRHWLPIYDYPNDKTTFEVRIITDKKYQTLSNGYLKSSSDIEGSNLREDHWVMDKPNSTYLIMIAIGEFNVLEENNSGLLLQTFTGKDVSADDAIFSFRNTNEIIKLFNEYFGYDYPWNKYAQIVVDEFIFGGMENTSATVLNKRLIINSEIEKNYSPESTISHEAGHQWWGDLVTCRNWKEFWINESFATYSAALWKEKKYGNDEYDFNILRNSDDAMRADSLIGRYPILGTYGNLNQNVYDKGSVIINSFRYILGDNFKTFLRTFLKDNEFDAVETGDITEALNKVSDVDFTPLIEQWILKAGYPEFNVNYNYDENKKELTLNVKQVQKLDSLTPVFRLPMDIRVKSAGEKIIKRIQINSADETFVIPVKGKPDFVIFDYGNNIMDKTYFNKPFSDWVNQIIQSEDAIDRITGLRGMQNFIKDKLPENKLVKFDDNADGYDILQNSLNEDTFWGVRAEAARILAFAGDKNRACGILIKSYDNQSNYPVKREIINSIGKLNTAGSRDFILNILKKESDGYIIAQCISAVKNFDKSEIYEIVIPFINKESHRNLVRDNVLEALDTADNQIDDARIKDAIMSIAFGKDIESMLRSKAINSLKKYAKDDDVIKKAKEVISINSPFVRRSAVNLLANSMDKTQTAFLKDLEGKTTDESLKRTITSAIKQLEENNK